MNLSPLIPKIGHGLIFLLMSACDINFSINLPVKLHFGQQVLVTGPKLIQPLNRMLIYQVQPIVGPLILGMSIIGPLVGTWDIDYDPVVLEGPHGHVGQDHGLACARLSA